MTVLEVNGKRIGRQQIRAESALLRLARDTAGGLEEDLRIAKQAEELVIDRVLMEQEAARLAITVSRDDVDNALAALMPWSAGIATCRSGADTSEMRAQLECRLRMDALLRFWLTHVGAPSPKQVREQYKKNPNAFWSPEVVRASHIVKNVYEGDDAAAAEKAMRDVRSLLCAGADFGATAAQYSDCPDERGDLGYFARGVMVEEFDAIVFTCPVGEFTDVFRTSFGYHVAMVLDRKSEGIRTFEEVRDELANALLREKQDREVGSRLAALRARAVIRRVSIA